MMGSRSGRAALAVLAVALGAGGASAQQAAAPAQTAPAVNSAASVGPDLNGGQCRWEARSDIPAERGAPQPAHVFWGDATRPTGAVTAALIPIGLPADPAARHRALERAAADTAVGRDDS